MPSVGNKLLYFMYLIAPNGRRAVLLVFPERILARQNRCDKRPSLAMDMPQCVIY